MCLMHHVDPHHWRAPENIVARVTQNTALRAGGFAGAYGVTRRMPRQDAIFGYP